MNDSHELFNTCNGLARRRWKLIETLGFFANIDIFSLPFFVYLLGLFNVGY